MIKCHVKVGMATMRLDMKMRETKMRLFTLILKILWIELLLKMKKNGFLHHVTNKLRADGENNYCSNASSFKDNLAVLVFNKRRRRRRKSSEKKHDSAPRQPSNTI